MNALALPPRSWTSGLRPPPGWPEGRAFPPTLEEARALNERTGVGRGASRAYVSADDEAQHAPGDSRSGARYPARRLVYAAALAAAGGDVALLEAFGMLRAVASVARGPLRTVALHNAAVVLARAQTLPLMEAAQHAATAALAFTEGRSADELRRMLLDLHDDMMGLGRPVPLAWKERGLLVAEQENARDRIGALPGAGLEGEYAGLRSVLLDYGLAAPKRALVRSPVRMTGAPSENSIRVERLA